MRIVFLDVDGVLNCKDTTDTFNGFKGIESRLVKNLAEFMEKSGKEEKTSIVLSSTWRAGMNKDGKTMPESQKYLEKKLAEHNLEIMDATPYIKWGRWSMRRGREIAGWLYENRHLAISGYAVLDDTIFVDFEKYGIMPHLVQTSWKPPGGFTRRHIKEAMKKIRLPFTA